MFTKLILVVESHKLEYLKSNTIKVALSFICKTNRNFLFSILLFVNCSKFHFVVKYINSPDISMKICVLKTFVVEQRVSLNKDGIVFLKQSSSEA